MAGVTSTSRPPRGNVLHVNPLVGTDGPDPTVYGGMVPSTAPPVAMTRWTPMTRENGISRCACHHPDPAVIGFLGSHQPAIWMGDWGHVAAVPVLGGPSTGGFCTFGSASTSTLSATEGEARPWVQATRAGLVASMSISSAD
jgi:putative alpha-1,2-mannosidase